MQTIHNTVKRHANKSTGAMLIRQRYLSEFQR